MAIPLQVFGNPASRACLQIRSLDGAFPKGSNEKLQKIMRGQILRENRYLVDNFGEMKKIILKGRSRGANASGATKIHRAKPLFSRKPV